MRFLASLAGPALLVLVLASPAARADQDKQSGPAQAFSKEDLAFFEKEVRPLLSSHCLRCHGPEKQRSHFRLDSREAILKGGDMGTAVNLKNPDASNLLKALQHEGDFRMPPNGKL